MGTTPIGGPRVAGLNYVGRIARVPGPIGTFLLSPIGWPWHLVTLLVVGCALGAWSSPGCHLGPAMSAVYGAVGLTVAWLGRLAAGEAAATFFGVERRWPLKRRLALPLAFVVTAILVYNGVPAAVVFRLSRGAMERAARTALANPSAASSPRRIGLYFDRAPQVIGTSVYFKVGGGGLWQQDYGYAYRPAGPPKPPLRASHLNDDAYCVQIEGPWYEWCGGYAPAPGPVPAWGAR